MLKILLSSAVIASIGMLSAAEITPDFKGNLLELRTYHAAPGKLDALLTRFRDHTTALFEKHGMTNVGYWVPVENSDNLLIYLMAYPDKEARDASWKQFLDDPEWKKAKGDSEVDGTLVDKVDQVFMTPTDFSEGFGDPSATMTVAYLKHADFHHHPRKSSKPSGPLSRSYAQTFCETRDKKPRLLPVHTGSGWGGEHTTLLHRPQGR